MPKCLKCGSENVVVDGEHESYERLVDIFRCNDCDFLFDEFDWEDFERGQQMFFFPPEPEDRNQDRHE